MNQLQEFLLNECTAVVCDNVSTEAWISVSCVATGSFWWRSSFLKFGRLWFCEPGNVQDQLGNFHHLL